MKHKFKVILAAVMTLTMVLGLSMNSVFAEDVVVSAVYECEHDHGLGESCHLDEMLHNFSIVCDDDDCLHDHYIDGFELYTVFDAGEGIFHFVYKPTEERVANELIRQMQDFSSMQDWWSIRCCDFPLRTLTETFRTHTVVQNGQSFICLRVVVHFVSICHNCWVSAVEEPMILPGCGPVIH